MGAVAAQLPQAFGERRFVLQPEERRGQHDVRNALAERGQRRGRRRSGDELRFQVRAHERAQLMRLVLVRLDGKDQRHGTTWRCG